MPVKSIASDHMNNDKSYQIVAEGINRQLLPSQPAKDVYFAFLAKKLQKYSELALV